ncbi:MAG: PRC-barrel domain-containing protein [Thermoplasmatota archaeon]
MLAELLDDYKVQTTVGEEVGRIKDVFFDIDKWTVTGFELSPGMFKKDRLLRIEQVKEIRDDEKLLIVDDSFQGGELPPSPSRMLFPMDAIKKKKVVDRNQDKVGKVYNMEIPYDKLKKLKVWKVLINTGFRERRLRIRPQDISDIKEDIHLEKSLEEYRNKME